MRPLAVAILMTVVTVGLSCPSCPSGVSFKNRPQSQTVPGMRPLGVAILVTVVAVGPSRIGSNRKLTSVTEVDVSRQAASQRRASGQHRSEAPCFAFSTVYWQRPFGNAEDQNTCTVKVHAPMLFT